MEYVVKEEARKVAERELKKARQLRQAQVRQQTVIWTEETRRRFEIEKERQIQLLASALTAQAQANVMARIEQINIEHDLAMAQVGAAQRAAAELKESQKAKDLKRLKNVEIAKQRGTSALKSHRSKVEKQKEDHLSVLQRKQQVRQTEDLKAKDLVERKPFKATNISSVPTSSMEKSRGPPEYQQSKAKTLRLAPSYQGQENNKVKSPHKTAVKSSPHKSRPKPKQEKKSKDNNGEKQPQLRPAAIGLFSKEVERRQSGPHVLIPKKTIEQPIVKEKQKKLKEKLGKTKVKPVTFYDATIPKSEIKYMPPPGLAERVEKEEESLNAWEAAEQFSKLSSHNVRNEESLNEHREMLAKYRGEKALELERLSRELQQLTEELVQNSDAIKIQKYSLEPAQLGLEDTEEEEVPEKSMIKSMPKTSPKSLPVPSPKSAKNVSVGNLGDSKHISPIHKSFESYQDSRSSSDSTETNYYSPSSAESSKSHASSIEIEMLKSKLFEALKEDLDDDDAETQVDSSTIPTKLSQPEEVSLERRKSPKISETVKEESYKICDSVGVLKSPTMHPTKLSSSSPTEYYSPSHTETSSRSDVHSSKESLKSKADDKNERGKAAPMKLVDVQVAERPSDHKSLNHMKTTMENLSRKSLSAPIQKCKNSSGSTTEYYSPPYTTSTPDGSKFRISETSDSFKHPMGVKESKALSRYVTKMLHMKRESIDRLSESESFSEQSKIVADSFQSEWSSMATSPRGSPSSVSSKTDVSGPEAHASPIISGSRHLHSVTEESEDSHPTTERSSSRSTLAKISLKIHPLSQCTSHSEVSSDRTSFKSDTGGTPLARLNISDSSLAAKLDALSDHQLKTLANEKLSYISNETSDNNKDSSLSSEDVINKYLSNSFRKTSITQDSNSTKSASRQQSAASDEGSLPDLSPILRRLRGSTGMSTEYSSSLQSAAKAATSERPRPDSAGSSSSGKEVLRGVGDRNLSKLWQSPQAPQSPVYNVTDHAELLSSVFGELRNQWANIAIERPPWCS